MSSHEDGWDNVHLGWVLPAAAAAVFALGALGGWFMDLLMRRHRTRG